MPGIAEGRGEGPEMFCAAHVPLGRNAGGFPSWSRSGCGKREAVSPPLLGKLP